VGGIWQLRGVSELPKAYEPVAVEHKWFQSWTENGCFRGDETSDKEGYSIVIPPPNVTGILHLGHVLNNTIQDILARRARMQGKEVMWLPGTDHAGIATQTKVEKKLRDEEGKSKRDIGRDAFLEKVWDWKEEHGGIIINQLKRMGASCDWERERFTMDAEYSAEVTRVFVDLFKEGLIYRGKRMVNWCPVSLTALSDEEVIPKPKQSKLYFVRYAIQEEEGRYIEIATTRPETIMGDSAIAVNPKDPRFADLIGKHAVRPINPGAIPIIADEAVEIDFGTGALKITPAHDKLDFEIGERHELEIIDVLHPDGTVNFPAVPELDGDDRFKARNKAGKMLDALGALVKVEEHENNVGFSERADVPIEPRISMQWFLRYPSVEESTDAVGSTPEAEITFRPERWTKTYSHWMNNLQDWCISRQLWWGHQIPVWYRKEKAFELKEKESLDLSDLAAGDIYVGTEPPADGDQWERDPDVMDTWFSSWLWPFSTMNEQAQQKFYPTADLVTGYDIMFFWVARMIMAGYRFKGQKPFNNVYFTNLVRDKQGRKMSKSLGNSPDPMDLMDRFGADAVRFALIKIAPLGGDIHFIENIIKGGENEYPQVEEGRNFANKLYNAARFRQMQGTERVSLSAEDLRQLPVFHQTILAKLDVMSAEVERAYADYRFSEVAQLLYNFFWGEYCDLFLEAIKGDFRTDTPAETTRLTLGTIDLVLARFLARLHPFMPHITEELSTTMGYITEGHLMSTVEDLTPVLDGIDSQASVIAAETIYATASKLRNLKAEYNLATRKDISLKLKTDDASVAAHFPVLCILVGLEEISIENDYDPPKGTPASASELGEFYLPLAGLIDVEAESKRLNAEIAKIEKELTKCEKKLSNPNFVERAKPEVVQVEKDRLEEWKTKRAQLQEMLSSLA